MRRRHQLACAWGRAGGAALGSGRGSRRKVWGETARCWCERGRHRTESPTPEMPPYAWVGDAALCLVGCKGCTGLRSRFGARVRVGRKNAASSGHSPMVHVEAEEGAAAVSPPAFGCSFGTHARGCPVIAVHRAAQSRRCGSQHTKWHSARCRRSIPSAGLPRWPRARHSCAARPAVAHIPARARSPARARGAPGAGHHITLSLAPPPEEAGFRSA